MEQGTDSGIDLVACSLCGAEFPYEMAVWDEVPFKLYSGGTITLQIVRCPKCEEWWAIRPGQRERDE